MPKVSVIIPNYNHAKFLKKRIDSVLNQTYQDFELIILDDCSLDYSKEIIESYSNHPKVSYIVKNTINSGSPFKQWKKGIELASGNYIWLAESDDYASELFLETLIKPFDEYNNLIISYCQSMLVDENNNNIGVSDWADGLDKSKWKNDYIESSTTEVNKYLKYRNTIPNASAVLFKKPNLNILDKQLLNMYSCGDWLFWKRLLSQSGKIAFFHKPLNFYRSHQASTRHIGSIEKETQRFKELRMFFEKNYFNIFENRYDWFIMLWSGHRSIFKGTLKYYIPNFPIVLIIRMYIIAFFRKLSRLISM